MLAYAAALSLLAVGLAIALAVTATVSGSFWVVLLLAVVAAIAERGGVQMSTTMDLEESISLLPILFAAVLLGPLAGLLVAAASMLGDFRQPYLRSFVYTASRAIIGGVNRPGGSWCYGPRSSDLGGHCRCDRGRGSRGTTSRHWICVSHGLAPRYHASPEDTARTDCPRSRCPQSPSTPRSWFS